MLCQKANLIPPPPKSQIDLIGGKHFHSETQASEGVAGDMENELDLRPGELTNDNPDDPNYRPASTRKGKWERFKDVGEV